MTPEELQKVAETVRKCGGSITEAAKELGIPRSTLKDQWNVVLARLGEPPVKAKAKKLEEQVAQLEEKYNRLRKAKFKIPKQSPARAKGSFTRVIVPDTHGCFIDEAAAAAFLADVRHLDPKEVIHIGDFMDCGGFLAQHHVWGYVAEADYTFEQDITAANVFFDQLQAAAPKAEFHCLYGNHDRRIERWCLTQALRNSEDAEFLLSKFAPEVVLHFKERGIKFYKQGQYYDGCRIPATIRRGHCYFTHGSKHGQNACRDMLKRFGSCVVFGHVHKLLSASDRNVKDGELGAWSVGCLCRLQPLWQHADPTDWCHGYGLQLVRPDGAFLHVNVPIIEGKSYLTQLVKG